MFRSNKSLQRTNCYRRRSRGKPFQSDVTPVTYVSVTQDLIKTARRKTSKRESRLRFETLNAFVDSGMADLSRAELAVWLILFRDTKRDGTGRASLDDLARRGGMNRQTASRAVGRLARRKMLQIVRRGGLNRGPSAYRVFPFPME
jgi:hypothetical protein